MSQFLGTPECLEDTSSVYHNNSCRPHYWVSIMISSHPHPFCPSLPSHSSSTHGVSLSKHLLSLLSLHLSLPLHAPGSIVEPLLWVYSSPAAPFPLQLDLSLLQPQGPAQGQQGSFESLSQPRFVPHPLARSVPSECAPRGSNPTVAATLLPLPPPPRPRRSTVSHR